MEQKFIVDTSQSEMRVALIEDGMLAEVFTETEKGDDVGNFYRGKVSRVVPALQAAFVDIGLGRDGFLPWDDVALTKEQRKQKIRRLENVLREGDELLVQMSKESIKGKGCRLTTRISIPGRYLVLLPDAKKVMVSKKIVREKERKRMKNIVSSLAPKDCGFIVRTVSEGVTKSEIDRDMKYLLRLWRRAQAKFSRSKKPGVLLEELNVIQRVLRDKWSKNCVEVVVDSQDIRGKVLDSLSLIAPRTPLRKIVTLHKEKDSVFHSMGVEDQIQKAIAKRVRLKSGGHIVIEEMESLTAIDVNSGKLTKGENLDEIALTTNIEAAAEIALHLRLRNIGGIVVVDFINLSSKRERAKVLRELTKHTKADRAVTNIYGFSELGVVQICRQRSRESLTKTLTVACSHCKATGRIPKYGGTR